MSARSIYDFTDRATVPEKQAMVVPSFKFYFAIKRLSGFGLSFLVLGAG